MATLSIVLTTLTKAMIAYLVFCAASLIGEWTMMTIFFTAVILAVGYCYKKYFKKGAQKI